MEDSEMKKRPVSFPHDKSLRVIICTDAGCESDDQYAIAHALMTPRFDIKAIIAEQFGVVIPRENTEEICYEELQRVVSLMDLTDEVKVLHGAKGPLTDKTTPNISEGARFIVEEANREDPRPLFICCQAALTNVASALLMDPSIAGKMTIVWSGGAQYPEGGMDFNQNNDLNAARIVYTSMVELWQVPVNVYGTMYVSYFELMNRVYPCGEIGKYLVENMLKDTQAYSDMIYGSMLSQGVPGSIAYTSFGGEIKMLGDSPWVGLLMNNSLGKYHYQDAAGDLFEDGRYDFATTGVRPIRVYDSIEARVIIADFFEKINYYYGSAQNN